MIGRNKERAELDYWMRSGRPEFIVVYGRRRVGKTYLVEQHFRGRFAFYATGVANSSRKAQLRAFREKLVEYGGGDVGVLEDWFDAFSHLKRVLSGPNVARDPETGRRVIFIDEMPWMDTQRSDFKTALEFFWNGWASKQEDVMLIACGSATSWLTRNLLKSTEGFYGRITGKLHLEPFTLYECEKLLELNDVHYSRQQVMELYLVFGGVPYYLNLVRDGLSPSQNVECLCFAPGCQLEGEFDMLFRSLFKHPDKYLAVANALAQRKSGMTNVELRSVRNMPTGTSLSRVLEDLVLCGFVRKNADFSKRTYGARYQLSDPYTAFHLKFLASRKFDSWTAHYGSQGYMAWRGNAFEMACIAHLAQIKRSLGIGGVETRTCSWASSASEPGAQVDLVIDRADGIIDLCEMKFTNGEFVINKECSDGLERKRSVFSAETRSRKAVHIVLVSASGVKRNKYYHTAQHVITADDLFLPTT